MTLQLARIGLQCRLWLARFGWSNSAALLLLVLGSAIWLWGVPHLKRQLSSQHTALVKAQQTLTNTPAIAAAPAIPQGEQRLQAFYSVLGESRYAEQQIKTLFALAAKNGVTLSQAEYKFSTDKSGGFQTYAILLPVHGSYAAIRPFCEKVLLAIPFASLDEVDFKREAVANPILEAKLRFTLHLDDAGPAKETAAPGPDGKQGGE